jgi:tetratricopeptide (TPR) repeat protein
VTPAPATVDGWLREGMACQDRGDLQGAETLYRKAAEAAPGHVQARGLLGMVQLRAGRAEAAVATFRALAEAAPDNPDAHHALGLAHLAAGQPEAAEARFKDALARAPEHPGAHLALGRALRDRGAAAEAVPHLERAAALVPRSPEPPYHLALALEAQGDLDGAADGLRRTLALAPDLAPAHARLGALLTRGGALTEALEHLEAWARLTPDDPIAHVERGLGHLRLGEMDAAGAAYDEALRLAPENLRALACKADLLERTGDFAAAADLLAPLVEAGTDSPDVAAVFAGVAPRVGRTEQALALLDGLLARPDLRPEVLPTLHFHAGRLRDKAGDYARAFDHYAEGNAEAGERFDRAAHTRFVDALIRVFSAEGIARMARAGNASELPVFIVGMPRSGTTLVEQIVASHPEAAGAGELHEITRFTQLLPRLPGAGGGGRPYPEGMEAVPQAVLDDLAGRYLELLNSIGPGAPRVTDKMPHNFLHLGLIARLFPAARIVHVARDPRDCCLSCFFQPFVGSHAYARDLADLGFYYREYERLVAHWKAVLDLPWLDVSYEALVADQEGESQRLIAFLDLEWDDACLRFQELDRTVATSSYDQVRRPMYASSVGRWEHYAAHLGPLLEALGDQAAG